MDSADIINSLLVLVTLIAVLFTRRAILVQDSPRLSLLRSNMNHNFEDNKLTLRCEVKNFGNGIAFQTFLIAKIVNIGKEDQYYLSKPEIGIEYKEINPRTLRLEMERPNTEAILSDIVWIEAYVVTIDFFKNIHRTKLEFSKNNDHLKKFLNPSKAVWRYSPSYFHVKQWMRMANIQGNSYADLEIKKREEEFNELKKKFEPVIKQINKKDFNKD